MDLDPPATVPAPKMASSRLRTKGIVAHLDERWKQHAAPAWLQGWSPIDFELGDGLTQVVTMGEGPPLLLLPPLPGYKEAWVACAATFAGRFRVITCDLRNRFAGIPRWDVLVDDLLRVLDEYSPGPTLVIGHSLGGALAQQLAVHHPERVRALVLSSSFARVTTPRGHWYSRYVEQPFVLAGQRLMPERLALAFARRWADRDAWVYDPRCDDHVLDFVRFCIRDISAGGVWSSLRLAFAHDTRASLGSLSCPSLLVVGERESPFARQAADELQRLIPGAELRVSPGVSHLHPLSSPEWLVHTVGDWLTPILAAPATDASGE